jgi:hypothetical protein
VGDHVQADGGCTESTCSGESQVDHTSGKPLTPEFGIDDHASESCDIARDDGVEVSDQSLVGAIDNPRGQSFDRLQIRQLLYSERPPEAVPREQVRESASGTQLATSAASAAVRRRKLSVSCLPRMPKRLPSTNHSEVG